eukprot:3401802-Alexandrium_andersonii.AAC.1
MWPPFQNQLPIRELLPTTHATCFLNDPQRPPSPSLAQPLSPAPARSPSPSRCWACEYAQARARMFAPPWSSHTP